MFSGIVQGIAEVVSIKGSDNDKQISFTFPKDFALTNGDSISINGVCLTVVSIKKSIFTVDISGETNKITTFSHISIGDKVNIEPSLKLGDSISGHFLSGHVDGVVQIKSIESSGNSMVVSFNIPPELKPFITRKGSVGIDGVSLTVNSVNEECFNLNIIPYTKENTIIGNYSLNDLVNIEIDIIARYIEKQLVYKLDSLSHKKVIK